MRVFSFPAPSASTPPRFVKAEPVDFAAPEITFPTRPLSREGGVVPPVRTSASRRLLGRLFPVLAFSIVRGETEGVTAFVSLAFRVSTRLP